MDVEYLAAAEWCGPNQSAITIGDRDLTILYVVENLVVDILSLKRSLEENYYCLRD